MSDFILQICDTNDFELNLKEKQMPTNSHCYHSNLILLLLCTLFLGGCAPSIKRIGYSKSDHTEENRNIPLTITYNAIATVQDSAIGVMRIYDNGFSTGCSEEEIVELIKQEATKLTATKVNLYNIREPSFWRSTCFQTDVAFYRDNTPVFTPMSTSQTTDVTYQKTISFDENKKIQNKGFRFLLETTSSPVISGSQHDIRQGWVDNNQNPINLAITKEGVGFGVSYLPKRFIGGTIQYAYKGTKATNGYDGSINLFKENLFRIGTILYPISKQRGYSLLNMTIEGGLNHTALKIQNEFQEKLQEAAQKEGQLWIPYSGSATGIGAYTKIGGEYIHSNRLILGLNIGYEWFNPKFKNAPQATDAQTIDIQLILGYKFKV